ASESGVWRVASTIPTIASATSAPARPLRRMNGARAVPGDRAREAVSERRARVEAETLLRAGGVELAPWLAVRLGRVPDELAVVPGELRDQLGEVADANLLAGAEIHRIGA